MLKRILGLLGWLGVALVFAAVAIRFLLPQYQQYYNGLAIAGLVCTLLYILSQWREIGQTFSGRQARFGTLAAASVLVVLGILIAVNYLSTKYNKRWDLTTARQFTLSEQTRKVLTDLKEPVAIRVFAPTQELQRFRDRLDEYGYHSKQISTEYIDMDRRPTVAEQYGVTSPTVVFEYKGRTEKVTGDGEQELTNGLIKVIQGRTPKIYFTQGHGEKDTASADRGLGYNGISGALTSENFVVDKLVLAQLTEVPADADVVVIAGPRTDFLGPEIDVLKAYLARGGKLLVMLDPVLKPDQPQPALLQALLKDWGIDAPNDIVLDVSGMGRLVGTEDATVLVAATYQAHPITQNFQLLTAFPRARSISPIEGGVNGRNPQKLVETSPRSWAERNLKSLSGTEPASADGTDLKGPVSLGVAVAGPATNAPAPKEPPASGETPKQTEARIVAFGDSDFASNGALGVQGNRDFFLNAVNWLAQQENLISIRPKDPEDRRITLTADQDRLIFYLTVLIVPGLIILAGVQTWWRRR